MTIVMMMAVDDDCGGGGGGGDDDDDDGDDDDEDDDNDGFQIKLNHCREISSNFVLYYKICHWTENTFTLFKSQ